MKKLLEINKKFFLKKNPAYKLLLFLLISAVAYHLFIYFVMKITKGDILYFGSRSIDQLDLFKLSLDGGYLEHYQYILLFWCFLLSSLINLRAKDNIISIPFIYFFLFIDDALSLHDLAYTKIIPLIKNSVTQYLEILRVKDFAELSYWFIVLLIVFLLSSREFINSSSAGRSYMKVHFSFFILLSIFGKLFDIINSNIVNWFNIVNIEGVFIYYIKFLFNLIEEIGEISTISLIFLYLFQISCESLLIKDKFLQSKLRD